MLFQCSLSLFEFQFSMRFWDTLQFSSHFIIHLFISLSVVKVAAQVAISGSDLWRRSFRCQSVSLRLTFLQSVCSVWVANHTKVPGRKQRPRRLGVVSLISTFRFSAFFQISFQCKFHHFIPFCILVLFIFGFGRFCLPGTSWNCCLSGPSLMLLLKQN